MLIHVVVERIHAPHSVLFFRGVVLVLFLNSLVGEVGEAIFEVVQRVVLDGKAGVPSECDDVIRRAAVSINRR